MALGWVGANGNFLASLISAPIPTHLHPAFTLESVTASLGDEWGGGEMSGQLAAAGWARRGHAALRLEVSVGERPRARLQRGRARRVCARVVRSDSVLCSARLTDIASPAEADRILR